VSGLRYIVGAGAQGRIVLETWRAQGPGYRYAFVDDDPELLGEEIDGVPVIGPIADMAKDPAEAVLAIGHNVRRLELAAIWTGKGIDWGIPVHPSAVVSPSAQLGPGAVVLPGAIVHTGAVVGPHVIVNTGAIVEHDCIVEDGASISPGVRMGGRVRLAMGVFLSTGVTVAPRVSIGALSIVGAGAVVVDDLPSGVLAYGVPAKVVRTLPPDYDWRELL
jgi:acetyltransferase EpsM